jgi:hypothetical protein
MDYRALDRREQRPQPSRNHVTMLLQTTAWRSGVVSKGTGAGGVPIWICACSGARLPARRAADTCDHVRQHTLWYTLWSTTADLAQEPQLRQSRQAGCRRAYGTVGSVRTCPVYPMRPFRSQAHHCGGTINRPHVGEAIFSAERRHPMRNRAGWHLTSRHATGRHEY